jgi:hypothetical protein
MDTNENAIEKPFTHRVVQLRIALGVMNLVQLPPPNSPGEKPQIRTLGRGGKKSAGARYMENQN